MTDDDKALIRELRTHQLDSTMAHEAADRIEALSAENERLKQRLEVVPGWSEDADGIACRDETIKLQDDRIEALSAEIERLQLLCDLNAVPAGIIEDRGRMEERAAIVAWLRSGGCWETIPYDIEEAYDDAANDIEAGEHLK